MAWFRFSGVPFGISRLLSHRVDVLTRASSTGFRTGWPSVSQLGELLLFSMLSQHANDLRLSKPGSVKYCDLFLIVQGLLGMPVTKPPPSSLVSKSRLPPLFSTVRRVYRGDKRGHGLAVTPSQSRSLFTLTSEEMPSTFVPQIPA